ncbi:MAG: HNH endonuclease [Nanoarchaeota archaeon]|nr:HNH endonuclease [Nanoarchaeota archaeon]MBU4348079.1 HNH endonuclease [Patescibacteria group bacterium]MCG2719996.1 HNH endonuclease [Nanoarchaeota archaeon]
MIRYSLGMRIKPIKIRGFGLQKKTKRSLGKNDKDILYLRAKKKCEGCGKKLDQSEMQVGHKTAYSKGGATTLANSACLCYRCNKLQGTGSLTTLKKKLAGTYGKRTKKSTKKKATTKKKVTKRKPINPFGIQPIKMPKSRLF